MPAAVRPQFPYLVYDIGSKEREITRIPRSSYTDHHRGERCNVSHADHVSEIRPLIVALFRDNEAMR